jgi:tetratricopeptide (TPR) repeat protein
VQLVRQAREAVLAAPRSAQTWGKLGMILMANDFQEEAQVCLAQAERFDPRDPRWPYFTGMSISLGDPEAGVAGMKRAVELWGDGPLAPRMRLGELLLRLGRREEAVAQFQKILARPADPSEAGSEFQRLANAQARARAHLGLARAAFAQGRFDESLSYLPGAAREPSTAPAAHILMAEIYQRRGDTAAADRERKKVGPDLPTLTPPLDPVYQEAEDLKVGQEIGLKRAGDLMKANRLGEAIALLRKLSASYPDSSGIWLKLGWALFLQGNLPESEHTLRRALKLGPNMVEGHYSLGVVLFEEKDFEPAARSFRRATELKPDHAFAYYHLGLCLQHQGNRPGAIEAYRNCCRAKPNLPEGHLSLGEVLAEAGETEEALAQVREATQLNPSDAKARKLLQDLEAKKASRPK